jgi:molecular chaperone DnaK
VTFDIDANGILNVSAKDKGTGKEQRITITASSGLQQEEIDRMVSEAEAHAEEDQRKREEVELRNNAENTAYAADKMLTDNADKVPADLKEEIEGKVAAVRSALQAEDTAPIKSAVDELQASMQKLGEAVYSQPGQDGPSAGDGSEGGDAESEGTVEGEYREV